MSQEEWDRIVAQLLEARRGRELDDLIAALSDEQRADAIAMLEVADLVWEAGHGAPPLEDDPVAAMLGLVPDPHYRLDSKAFARVRRSANMKPTDLADRLARRGWDVAAADVFRWETRGGNDVAPALVRAIAEVLHTDPDRLSMDAARVATSSESALSAVTQNPRFHALADRLATLQGVTAKFAASTLEARMLATVHRGEHPDAEQLIASLEALVRALETEHVSDDG